MKACTACLKLSQSRMVTFLSFCLFINGIITTLIRKVTVKCQVMLYLSKGLNVPDHEGREGIVAFYIIKKI